MEHFVGDFEQLQAENKGLRKMIMVLSALVDIQELPKGIEVSDYKRLLAGAAIRPRHQLSPKKEKKPPLARRTRKP